MPNPMPPEEICTKLNALSHGQLPQDHWPAANWTHDADSGTYCSNAVAPGSLISALGEKPGFRNGEFYAAPIGSSAGEQMVLSENLAQKIATKPMMQIPFSSVLFDYGPTGAAGYLGSTLGGTAWC